MPDQTLDLSTYLAQLEAQRATLSVQIAGVRAALGLPPENGAASSASIGLSGGTTPSGVVTTTVIAGRVRPDEFFRMSVPEGIRRYLEIMKQPQTPKEIAEGLKAGGILSEAKHFYANVFTSLKRLRKQNLVMNTKRGGWGLAEWYAGRSGAAPDSKPKVKKRATKAAKSPKAAKKPKKGAGTVSPTKKPAASYQAFVGEQIKAGKTMAQAAEAWRKQKGEED